MSEDTFDAIVIGAGENGLVLGNYLGKAGLNVVVCERRLESGGGLSTEEFTIPGCWHNTGAYYHDTVQITPVYEDLSLPSGIRRAATLTFAPSLAKANAAASPIPELPPVIKTTLSFMHFSHG